MRAGGRGCYMWSSTSVKEKVGLSVGVPIRGRLIGGEIRYAITLISLI